MADFGLEFRLASCCARTEKRKTDMIRQIPAIHPLPDWGNLGVMLRVLLGVNLATVLAALVQLPGTVGWLGRLVELAAFVEPLLLAALAILALLRRPLLALPARPAQAVVVGIVVALALALGGFWLYLGLAEGAAGSLWRAALLAGATAVAVLAYFELRARAFSPAVTEARLAALNARIRPHFLFNSLNAVLSLIRAEPRRAEEALEALSDLFRAALRDPKEMTSLSDEIALARQYLELERLRLGERLRVAWEIAEVPLDCQIPPLMLQPLIENAVYHGIEPMPEGGTIRIAFARQGEGLRIVIANPVAGDAGGNAGNRMALANIRERLALYYDLEARLDIEQGATEYLVRISLPCRTLTSPSVS